MSYAVNAGIFDDVSSYSGSADRDTVAQMAYNTLLADLVEYPSGNIIIDSGDTSIVINGSGASRIENTSSSDGNIDDDGYYQFAERYFSDLELVDVANGDYGRPVSYNWELDGYVITPAPAAMSCSRPMTAMSPRAPSTASSAPASTATSPRTTTAGGMTAAASTSMLTARAAE